MTCPTPLHGLIDNRHIGQIHWRNLSVADDLQLIRRLFSTFYNRQTALKRRLVRVVRHLNGAGQRPIRVVRAAPVFRPIEAGGDEILPANIRDAIVKDPYQWMDRRLFQGKDSLIFDNIQGRFSRIDVTSVGRHGTIDLDTGTWQLMRALVYALTKGLGLHPVLPENTSCRHLRGIGLSGNRFYARALRRYFDYTNTFFHKKPFLDICSGVLPYSNLDFIISSEVFEHVPPPPDVAFRNSCQMLKSGGVLILTVPYDDNASHTVEHYPSLHHWKLRKKSAFRGSASNYYIENINVQGKLEIFDTVRFHGGTGQTVEMRMFSKSHLLELAAQNGLTAEIVVEDVPLFGIWNQGDSGGLPIILRKA